MLGGEVGVPISVTERLHRPTGPTRVRPRNGLPSLVLRAPQSFSSVMNCRPPGISARKPGRVFQGHDAGNANAMRMLTRLETADSLDPVSDKLQEAVAALVRPRRVRDWLHGTWLGHPLHPVLVQAPVGAFVCAAVLDLIPGRSRSATTLIAAGTASAAPAI